MKRIFLLAFWFALLSAAFFNVSHADVTVDDAVRGGCLTAEEVRAKITSTLGKQNLGSKTKDKLLEFQGSSGIRDGSVTRSYVTHPETWGYRSLTIPKEEEVIVTGKLYSKALHQLQKMKEKEGEFWTENGPQIDPSAQSDEALTLRMLATSSSDIPPSQFLSVALTQEVARRFGTGTYVYRFQMNPNSPVLGMENCQLDKGEVQIQVPGNTPIRNLQ